MADEIEETTQEETDRKWPAPRAWPGRPPDR